MRIELFPFPVYFDHATFSQVHTVKFLMLGSGLCWGGWSGRRLGGWNWYLYER